MPIGERILRALALARRPGVKFLVEDGQLTMTETIVVESVSNEWVQVHVIEPRSGVQLGRFEGWTGGAVHPGDHLTLNTITFGIVA